MVRYALCLIFVLLAGFSGWGSLGGLSEYIGEGGGEEEKLGGEIRDDGCVMMRMIGS